MPRPKKQLKNKQSFLSQIKWGESYTSLFLGAIVVVVGLILLFSFLRARNSDMQKQATSTSTKAEQNILPSTYTVKSGEDLWSISQKIYGSGYNWVDLANANKLSNPEKLEEGTKLVVPNVKIKVVENTNPVTPTPIVEKAQSQQPQQTTLSGNSYTVVKGDCLWNIAVRAYGDGFKWTEIAKANNLTNPNIIHPGNVFVLPR